MTKPVNSAAASRRENARQTDGKFGHQHHSEAEVSLSDSGLTDGLRQAIMYNKPLVRIDSREDDGSGEPPVILEDPQNYPFTIGEYQDWDVATADEVQAYQKYHNDQFDQDQEKREWHDQALHNIQDELQTMFDKHDRGYFVKSVDFDRQRQGIVAQIDTGSGRVRPWNLIGQKSLDSPDPGAVPLDEDDASDFGPYGWTVSGMLRDNMGKIDCGWQQTEREKALDALDHNHEFDTWSLNGSRSPWGTVQHVDPTGSPHISFVSTDSHGGYKVSQEANKLIPSPLRKRSGWYEEDCERAHVNAAFPTAAQVGTGATVTAIHASAIDSLRRWNPEKAKKAGLIS